MVSRRTQMRMRSQESSAGQVLQKTAIHDDVVGVSAIVITRSVSLMAVLRLYIMGAAGMVMSWRPSLKSEGWRWYMTRAEARGGSR